MTMKRSVSSRSVRTVDPAFDDGRSELKRRNSSKGCLKKYIDDETSDEIYPSMKKQVSFHRIEISEFPIELGDNPCTSGLPLTIGWVPENKHTFNVEMYELLKPARRDKAAMHIPSTVRFEMLKALGTSRKEMKETIEETKKIRMRRSKSVNNMKWDKMNFALETAQRKMKRVVSLGSLARWTQKESLDNMVTPVRSEISLQDGPIMF